MKAPSSKVDNPGSGSSGPPNAILRFAGVRPGRWRNGAGTTREIASAGDATGHFTWRLSMAEIEQPGAFSLFPDTERIFTVVDGERVVLQVEGREHQILRNSPFGFPGGASVTANLPAGPVRALNVIARPNAVRAQVAILDLLDGPTREVPLGSFAVLLSGRAAVRVGGTDTELSIYDTVRGTHHCSAGITGSGVLAVVSFEHRGGGGVPGL